MLIQEQKWLYSHESTPPQEPKAKAARHTTEKRKLQKFTILIQQSEVVFMFDLGTRDTSDFAQLY